VKRFREAASVRTNLLAFGRTLADRLPPGSAPRNDLASAMVLQGKGLIDNGMRREAETLFRVALALSPGHDAATNDLAWVLSTHPGSSPYNPDEAVALAEKAVTTSPSAGVLWNTMGVAYFRAGDRAKAEEAFRRSMELREGGDPNDWLFMCMCRWESGDKAGAREWFDRSQSWMARYPSLSRDPDLQSFLREASTVLGLPEPPPPPNMPVTTGTTLHDVGASVPPPSKLFTPMG